MRLIEKQADLPHHAGKCSDRGSVNSLHWANHPVGLPHVGSILSKFCMTRHDFAFPLTDHSALQKFGYATPGLCSSHYESHTGMIYFPVLTLLSQH